MPARPTGCDLDRRARKERDLTQKELAGKARLSGRTLSAIETGSANPT